jgi:hypothetical protein
VKQIKLKTQDPNTDQGPAWSNLVCNADISDIARIKTTHLAGGGIDFEDYFFEGFNYEIRPLQADYWEVELTADLSPRALFSDGYELTT